MPAHSTRIAAVALTLLAAPLAAQQHDSVTHASHAARATSLDMGTTLPTMPGQDAYGAIAEVVRLLDANPSTEWASVNVEALRQHLIDMNEVTLHSSVAARAIVGGLQMDVTGDGRTASAIRRMASMHSRELTRAGLVAMSATEIPGGARVTAIAIDTADARQVARVRGLGFIGLMTLGDHHMPHHLGIATGQHPMGPTTH